MQIPVRCLALLWRSSADPEGAALWNPDDVPCADLMQLRRLGHVEKRRTKPHQRSLPMTDADEWTTYFVINERGRWLWNFFLGHMEAVMHGDPVPGFEGPF